MTDLVPVTRTIVDDEVRLRRALEAIYLSGRLLTAPENVRAVRLRSGLWHVSVRMMEPAPKLTRRDRIAAFDRRHPILGPCLKALAFGVTVLGLVAGALFGIGYLVVASVGLRTLANVGLLVLIVLGIILYACTRGGDHGHRKGYGYHWTRCK